MLEDLSLTIPAGQRVVVAGPSGSGKSTLLRAFAGLLLTADHGELSGSVTVDGVPVEQCPGAVALLLQDPTASRVAETVGRDVAFGLENRALPRAQIWPRVMQALAESGFPYAIDHLTAALSGGEMQRLALAGSLAIDSPVLLLDEPTSMLDPESAAQVGRAVRQQLSNRDTTLVVVEHHIGPWLDLADRLIVLAADGSIAADGRPDDVLASSRESLLRDGVWMPDAAPPVPLDVDPALVGPGSPQTGALVEAEQVGVDLTARLSGGRRQVAHALAGVSCELMAGSVLAAQGRSGAGKSTLVAVLAGLLKPTRGAVVGHPSFETRRGRAPWAWRSVDLAARLAWVPQIAEHGVVTNSVMDEVLATSRATGVDPARARARAEGLLETLGLSHLHESSPYHLSGGEQRRLMLAAALTHAPAALLLDEPTVGQDRLTWAATVGVVSSARRSGAGVAIATHDQLAVNALADKTIRLAAGVVVG